MNKLYMLSLMSLFSLYSIENCDETIEKPQYPAGNWRQAESYNISWNKDDPKTLYIKELLEKYLVRESLNRDPYTDIPSNTVLPIFTYKYSPESKDNSPSIKGNFFSFQFTIENPIKLYDEMLHYLITEKPSKKFLYLDEDDISYTFSYDSVENLILFIFGHEVSHALLDHLNKRNHNVSSLKRRIREFDADEMSSRHSKSYQGAHIYFHLSNIIVNKKMYSIVKELFSNDSLTQDNTQHYHSYMKIYNKFQDINEYHPANLERLKHIIDSHKSLSLKTSDSLAHIEIVDHIGKKRLFDLVTNTDITPSLSIKTHFIHFYLRFLNYYYQ